jgi:chromatin segregation and condensation protein Rec8/ScpA/Scc1 (kleisin family)
MKLPNFTDVKKAVQSLKGYAHKTNVMTSTTINNELGALLNIWHQHQAPLLEEEKQDKVGVFWALLLLSSQSKVELSQDEFYQDLKIQVILK